MAEKLITLGKRNTEASRQRALSIFYVCVSSVYLDGKELPPTISRKLPSRMCLNKLLTQFPGIEQTPHQLLPKLFGPLRERYLTRPGGYTRVLRVEPKKDDQAPSAILELVDGPRDMRFAMTAKSLARQRASSEDATNDVTALNVRKVTRFRPGGQSALEKEVKRIEAEQRSKNNGRS